ncbi:MAG: cytochrome P460 family protein [Pseudomonadota bacterium]
MRALAIFTLCVLLLARPAVAEEQRIQFPEDYRSTFTNYLNLDRTQNDDQIIHLYANQLAIDGLRDSGTFPDGSVLIGEVYKAKKDEAGEVIESILGHRIRGKLALVAVMEKRAGWGDAFSEDLRNGDWDFAAFKPDGSIAKKDLDECRACHAPLGDLQHVFSIEHLQ